MLCTFVFSRLLSGLPIWQLSFPNHQFWQLLKTLGTKKSGLATFCSSWELGNFFIYILCISLLLLKLLWYKLKSQPSNQSPIHFPFKSQTTDRTCCLPSISNHSLSLYKTYTFDFWFYFICNLANTRHIIISKQNFTLKDSIIEIN